MLQIRSSARFPLDWLWATFSLGLALNAIYEASNSLDYEVVLYFLAHLATAVLFLIRRPAVRRSPYKLSYVVACLSTFYVYLYSFNVIAPPAAFLFGRTIMLIGSTLCLLSILSLGQYFGVLPMCRGVQMGWMYRIIRHPIYSSYILMDIGLVISYPSFTNMVLLLTALTLFICRIHYEELLMKGFDTYREYMLAVRFRLFPLLY